MYTLFEEEHDLSHISQEIDQLQRRYEGPKGYRLRRIILINYWLYETQIFEIPHGRLFLAGANASGKSTVLTAALPLLLEGNLRADRLDTFGRQSRHIEYYILGNDTSATPFSIGEDKRTAHLALEFEWSDPHLPPIEPSLYQRWESGKSTFLTIGMSITGNKRATGARITTSHFLITDGSRLFSDIPVPDAKTTMTQFREALKKHGVICSTSKEYEEYVAHYLFGIKEMSTFHKLIDLLLALRQPNLSSRLTLSDVHTHLTNSLPIIPSDVTRQAVEAVNTIEELTTYITKLDYEQQKVQEIETAQQALIIIEARLAFDIYRKSLHKYRLQETSFQSLQLCYEQEVAQLVEIGQKISTIEQAKQQALGAIQALERNEGIKLATRVVQVEQRVIALRSQVTQHHQNVDSIEQTISSYQQKCVQQAAAFQHGIQEDASRLKNLYQIAEKQAHWQNCVLYLQEGLKGIEEILLQRSMTSTIVQKVVLNLQLDSKEHLDWLRNIDILHHQKNELTREIDSSFALEKEKQYNVDLSWKHFKNALLRFKQAYQQVNVTLAQIFAASTSQTLDDAEFSIDVSMQSDSDEDEEFPGLLKDFDVLMANVRTRLDASKRDLESTLHIVAGVSARVQKKIEDLLPEIAEKNIRYKDLQKTYEEKQRNRENLLIHPARRTTARDTLAAHGIQAFPLYLLIDFAAGLDSEEAGRREYVLEDAGLLDALVLLEQDCQIADNILFADNNSDYRISIEDLPEVPNEMLLIPLKLCFDKAVSDLIRGEVDGWEVLITKILYTLEQTIFAKERTGAWIHGFLTGQSARGMPQFIGRSTRLQIKRQELETLYFQFTSIAEELTALSQSIDQYKKHQEHLRSFISQLQNLQVISGLDAAYSDIQAFYISLEQAQQHLTDARKNTYQKRQQRTSLLISLEESCISYPPFAQQHDMVIIAMRATDRLTDALPSFCRDLQHINSLYLEIQSTEQLLERAKREKESSTILFHQLQNQFFQEESTLSELQHMAKQEGVDDLSQRLQQLHQKTESLDNHLKELTNKRAVLEDHTVKMPEELKKQDEQNQSSQYDLQRKCERYLELLSTASVNVPEEIRYLAVKDDEARVSQILQMPEQDAQATSSTLELEVDHAWVNLQEMYRTCATALHAYEPGLDLADKRITFYHENSVTPAELLNTLEKNKSLQQNLLLQEEKQLFEQFLLEDMADMLRMRITQAFDWIRDINASLAAMPFIGDRYELEWQEKTSFDDLKLPFGHFLAQHLPLLRKKTVELSDGNRRKLKEAFIREIHGIWESPQGNEKLTIEQRLQVMFDYRQWFHFKIYTISQAEQRQHLTSKLLASRSGAEQLFALYVPLLAALTALYNSAAPGAPRLLGLDEAFDKASLNNMQQMIGFLAKQDFQWIMTGPQLNITSAKVPVIIRYLMLRENTTATAIPQIWRGGESES